MIGVALTTYGRPDLFDSTYEQILKYLPPGAEIAVVQDVTPIAKAKNRCLALLDDCDDIFLFDDDTFPIADNWWKPYIASGENHMMYQFDLPGKPLREVYRDRHIVAYDKTRGAMLYVTKKVLETVGGMDERYYNSFEHPDWSWRIYNAGLTTYRAMDFARSDKLLYCLDQDQKINSSIINVTNRENALLYKQQRKTKDYMRYK